MGHAARGFDALGVNPAILLGKQRRESSGQCPSRYQLNPIPLSLPAFFLSFAAGGNTLHEILPTNGHLLPGTFQASFAHQKALFDLPDHLGSCWFLESGTKLVGCF